VIEQADCVTSTSGMIKYARETDADEFIIATEMGMVNRLQIEVPNKKFYTVGGMCVQMKKNSLALVLSELKNEKNEINVPEDIRLKAKRSLDRMLEISIENNT